MPNNQQQVVAAKRRKYGNVSPGSGIGRGIPPKDMYTLRLDEILDLDYNKGYQGEEPKLQFKLEFSILDYEDPDTGEPMKVVGWYTPKLHAIEGYPEPKLYKMVAAMNGGEPIELETDEDGNVLEYNAWDILEDFLGKTFRDTVGPNQKGWARISGEEPLPVRAQSRRTSTASVKKRPVKQEVDEETGEILDGDVEVDF